MKKEVIIGVIVFIISTPLGYFFNSYISRDQLSIENVEFFTPLKSIVVNRDLLHEIYESKEGRFITRGSDYHDLIPDELEVVHVPKVKKKISKIRKDAKSYITSIDDEIEVVNGFLNDNRIVIDSINWYLYPRVFRENKDSLTANELIDSLENRRRVFTSYLKKVDLFLNELSFNNRERTGDIEFKLFVLNSGGTDGLVLLSGRAMVEGYQAEIPLVLKQNEVDIMMVDELESMIGPMLEVWKSIDYMQTTIKKRSISVLTYVVNKNEISSQMHDELNSLVQRNSSINIKVILNDFRNEEIASDYYKLYSS